MPYHLLLDHAGEARLGKLQIGTTRRGIGPCYADKAARLGIRVQDLLDEKILKKKIVAALEPKRLSLRPFAADPELDLQRDDRGVPDLRPPPRAVHHRHRAARLEGCSTTTACVIFEGAQGAMLDIDHGTYPFVTSSNPVAGAACVGAGVGPKRHRRGVGDRQGLRDARGRGAVPDRARRRARRHAPRARRRVRHDDRPRAAGRLARPRRRCATRAASTRLTALVITKLDVLSGLDELLVCTAYRSAGRGRASRSSPTTSRCCTTPSAEYERVARLGGGPQRVPHRGRTCRPRPATTSRSSRSTSASRSSLIGVGPGREQVIWTKAAAETVAAGAIAVQSSGRTRGRAPRRGAAGAGRGPGRRAAASVASVICTLSTPSSVQ